MTAAPAAPAPPQLDLTFAADAGGVTRLARRRVRYPYAFLKPFWFGDRPAGIATAIVQSGSGGLFGGERLGQAITLEPGAAAHVTNQSAAIVHAARDQPATWQEVRLHLAAGSHLEYLPEPMLLFPDAALEQRIAAVLEPSALLLLGDGVARHDPDDGEGLFRSLVIDLEVRLSGGPLLFADRSAVTGTEFAAALRGGGRTWRACGWFAAIAAEAPRQRACADGIAVALRECAPLAAAGRLHAAAATLPNGAGHWCRIVATDGAVLRTVLRSLWWQCRIATTGQAPARVRK